MKKILFSILTVSGMLLANASNAQNQYVALSGKSSDNRASATSTSEGMKTLATTNQKAYKNFVSHYSTITDISVTNGKTVSIVVFKDANVMNRICYSKKGELLNTVRYYDAAMLPQNVKDIIKAQYAGYSLFGVTEVTIDDKTGYLVKIENDKYWRTIKVVDGETEETEKFQKATP